jgi:hypothetical protein
MAKLFIAVVTNQDPTQTARPDSTLSSFVGYDKEAVIQKAVLAVQRWQNQIHQHDHEFVKAGSPYGPYRVLVGELTEEAKFNQFEIVEI